MQGANGFRPDRGSQSRASASATARKARFESTGKTEKDPQTKGLKLLLGLHRACNFSPRRRAGVGTPLRETEKMVPKTCQTVTPDFVFSVLLLIGTRGLRLRRLLLYTSDLSKKEQNEKNLSKTFSTRD